MRSTRHRGVWPVVVVHDRHAVRAVDVTAGGDGDMSQSNVISMPYDKRVSGDLRGVKRARSTGRSGSPWCVASAGFQIPNRSWARPSRQLGVPLVDELAEIVTPRLLEAARLSVGRRPQLTGPFRVAHRRVRSSATITPRHAGLGADHRSRTDVPGLRVGAVAIAGSRPSACRRRESYGCRTPPGHRRTHDPALRPGS